VDAPDLPPEEAEFFITSVGIADTEKGEVPEAQGLDFEVETLYEEESNAEENKVSDNANDKHSLIDVKGIGAGTAKNLIKVGVGSVKELVSSNPEQVASKINGVSLNLNNYYYFFFSYLLVFSIISGSVVLTLVLVFISLHIRRKKLKPFYFKFI